MHLQANLDMKTYECTINNSYLGISTSVHFQENENKKIKQNQPGGCEEKATKMYSAACRALLLSWTQSLGSKSIGSSSCFILLNTVYIQIYIYIYNTYQAATAPFKRAGIAGPLASVFPSQFWVCIQQDCFASCVYEKINEEYPA